MEQELEVFRQAILLYHPACTSAEWAYLKSGLGIRKLKAKEHYLQAGGRNHELAYVNSGLMRAYYINDLGEDITILFAKENEYATDYPSFVEQRPSRYFFQCLERTTLITLPYRHMQAGYQTFPGFERYGRLVAEEVLKLLQKRIESFQFHDAEQRYLDFVSQNKELFNRISLTHLSSYLGIERPSLSRIRKKIARP